MLLSTFYGNNSNVPHLWRPRCLARVVHLKLIINRRHLGTAISKSTGILSLVIDRKASMDCFEGQHEFEHKQMFFAVTKPCVWLNRQIWLTMFISLLPNSQL